MAYLSGKHPQAVSLSKDIEGTAQGTFAFDAAAQSSALAEGVYDVWCDQDCYIKIAPTANDVTTSSGYLVLKNLSPLPFVVRANSKIGAIKKTSAGNLYFQQIG